MDESPHLLIEVLPAGLSDQPVMENLMHLYLYDFTEWTGDDVDEQGRFVDEYLDRYWEEPHRHPFLVKVAGKYAGFVLVREISGAQDGGKAHSIAEFFILKKYRRQRVGRQVAWLIFDRFPGRWHVAEVEENFPAQNFWRNIIHAYTGGRFQEVREPGWDGPVQVFHSPNP
jgi:predicted acetyltransferase